VHQSGNEFSLRVPMVVAPRYNPAPVVQSVDFRPDGSGWGATSTDPVPDRDRISPPVLDPAQNAPVNPTTVTVSPAGRFPARRRQEPSSFSQGRRSGFHHARDHAGRGARCRRTAISN